jgi:glutathione gamma-glutamylcysteinyltransferase
VAFASVAGQRLLREALAGNGGAVFYKLIEQFTTQSEPSYCGLGTLVVILNAMAVDPGRQWKGPWRWFSEELLDCCEPLESIAVRGITIDRFACLAACNGATAVVHRALESGERTRSSSAVGAADGEAGEPAELHAFRETVRAICAGEAPPATSSDGCCAGAGSGYCYSWRGLLRHGVPGRRRGSRPRRRAAARLPRRVVLAQNISADGGRAL